MKSVMRRLGVALLLISICAVNSFSASPEDPVITSRIHREPVTSGALAGVGYSKRLHALEIEFRNGAIYRYEEVPPAAYRALLSANSKARYYDENIRGHYHSLHVKPTRAKEASDNGPAR